MRDVAVWMYTRARFLPAFCCGTDRKGQFRVIRLTAKKRMRATLAAIRAALMRRRHEPVSVIGAWLNRVVRGYFNYHAVPTNLLRLDGFRSEVCRSWRHVLLRRSQRHRMCWDRFNRLATRFFTVSAKAARLPGATVSYVITLGKSRMR
jgi:hypothetical protein